ncbi:MAG: hypothetical protein GIW99_07315 [Candidatus Eremiobacteraeota bacterium]|nr:hypothetical protein [Candidatus Eremiobacteraeota bacterium]
MLEQGSQHVRSGFSKAVVAAYIKALAPLNPDRFVAGARAPILMQDPDQDAFISRAMLLDYLAHAHEPKSLRWYVGCHELNDPAAQRDRIKWLAQLLHF